MRKNVFLNNTYVGKLAIEPTERMMSGVLTGDPLPTKRI